MGDKYLQSKQGSLEEIATKIAVEQPTIVKQQPKVTLQAQSYFSMKENSLADVAARVVSESLIKEEKFKADYTIEKRAPRHISDEEDEGESYGSITVSAKDAGEAKKKIEDEIDKRIDKMKKNPNLKGYSFEGYIDGSVQKISEALDPVNKDAVKKDFKNRNDKDIDNDGDVDSTDKYLHTRRQAISKAVKSETHTFTAQPINQKQKDTKGEKEVINPIKEGKMKDIATDQSELKRLNARLSQLKDKKAADQGDTTDIVKDILQTQRSIKNVQIRLKNVPKEVKENIKEDGETGGGIYALRAIRDKRERLQDQLRDLDKKDPNYKQKADTLKKQIENQKEIMHRKQREVFGSYDPSIREARWEIEGRVNYKGVGPEDGFHMVIDAPNQDAAEDKAFDELVKARKQRKIGPGGGGGIDEMEIEYIEKTNDRLQPVTQQVLGNSYDPSLKEDDMGKFHKMQKDGKSADEIAKALELDVKSVKKLMDLDEVVNPYAVGMAQAMKSKNDKPPLEKSTITKAHDIAKSIMKKEQVCPKCGKDHANKINASNCMGESKKTFSDLRTETKVIKLGDKGKTATGKEAGAVDVEPRAIPV